MTVEKFTRQFNAALVLPLNHTQSAILNHGGGIHWNEIPTEYSSKLTLDQRVSIEGAWDFYQHFSKMYVAERLGQLQGFPNNEAYLIELFHDSILTLRDFQFGFHEKGANALTLESLTEKVQIAFAETAKKCGVSQRFPSSPHR